MTKIILGALVLLAGVLLWLIVPSPAPSRFIVAEMGPSPRVISYDPKGNTAVLIQIPSDTVVEAAHGYGMYSIASLWELDTLEKRHGTLFMETLEGALGIPIRFFLALNDESGEDTPPESMVQSAFSFSSFIRTLGAPKKTNMPLSLWYRLIFGALDLDRKDVTVVPVSSCCRTERTLPDGADAMILDGEKIAVALGTHGEDTRIRDDGLRVSILNTTDTPGLAQHVARIFELLGMHVVSVGNDQTVRPHGCVVRGEKTIRDTFTYKVTQWLYSCTFEEMVGHTTTDMTVLLGSVFEKRGKPYEK